MIETSARNSQNVEKAFMTLASEIKSKVSKANEPTRVTDKRITEVPPPQVKDGGCC